METSLCPFLWWFNGIAHATDNNRTTVVLLSSVHMHTFNPITGGGGNCPPPGDFSDVYQKQFALAPWNFGTFPNQSLGVLCQNLPSNLAQRRFQGNFCGGTFRWTSSFPTFSADQRAAEACNNYWWYPSQFLCINNNVTSLGNVTGTAYVSIGGSREGNTGGHY